VWHLSQQQTHTHTHTHTHRPPSSIVPRLERNQPRTRGSSRDGACQLLILFDDPRAESIETDTQRSMLRRTLHSATCVQRFDDSLNSAIRMTYRISLRSSSLWEPRYPLLRVVFIHSIRLSHPTTCLPGFKSHRACTIPHTHQVPNTTPVHMSIRIGTNRQPIMILPQVHLRKPCYDFCYF
jgi:hypothetical protein